MQEKWRELRRQLAKAVWPDSQLRVFYCGTYPAAPLPSLLEGAVDMGLVFTCTRGTVDLYEGGICGALPRHPAGPLSCLAICGGYGPSSTVSILFIPGLGRDGRKPC